MRNLSRDNLFVIVMLGSVLWFNAACASAQSSSIKPLPIYEQCRALNTAGAADDAVVKTIAGLKDADAKTRIQAIHQLSQSCDKRAIDPLLDLLGDQEPTVRAAAVEALGKLGDQETVQFLIDITGDQDPTVRMALISALASFPTFKARNAVVNNIANPNGLDISDEGDLRVRCAAILTVCQFKDVSHSRKSILFLHEFLNSRQETTRKLAEQTMLELKNTRNAQNEMIAILKQSNNPSLRRWAATWIGKIRFSGAREALQEAAATDSDSSVKQLAAESLKMLAQ